MPFSTESVGETISNLQAPICKIRTVFCVDLKSALMYLYVKYRYQARCSHMKAENLNMKMILTCTSPLAAGLRLSPFGKFDGVET